MTETPLTLPRELLEAIGELAMAIEPHYFDTEKRKRIAHAIGVLIEHVLAVATKDRTNG